MNPIYIQIHDQIQAGLEAGRNALEYQIIREEKHFLLTESKNRYYIKYIGKDKNKVHPVARRISENDKNYLINLSKQEFNSSCILEFGVAMYQKTI